MRLQSDARVCGVPRHVPGERFSAHHAAEENSVLPVLHLVWTHNSADDTAHVCTADKVAMAWTAGPWVRLRSLKVLGHEVRALPLRLHRDFATFGVRFGPAPRLDSFSQHGSWLHCCAAAATHTPLQRVRSLRPVPTGRGASARGQRIHCSCRR